MADINALTREQVEAEVRYAPDGRGKQLATALLAAWDALDAERKVSEWLAERCTKAEWQLSEAELDYYPANWLTAAREAVSHA